jgi:ATP-binding cassette, subfamily C (CFTR/MRP), member 1
MARNSGTRNRNGASEAESSISNLEDQASREIRPRWYQRVKQWLRATAPPIPSERTESRETSANILSQWTFQWINPLIVTGYKRRLDLNDIWYVSQRRRVGLGCDEFHKAFARHVARRAKHPLLRAFVDSFGFDFYFGGICQLVAAIVQVLNPYVLRYLIEFTEEALLSKSEHRPGPTVGRGIGLVFAITILQLVQSSYTDQFLYRGMLVDGQVQGSLYSIIFQKSMTLAPGARPQRRQPVKRAQKKNAKGTTPGAKKTEEDQSDQGMIVTLMSVHGDRVSRGFDLFHLVWTSPVAIILTLVLLIINITYSAVAGFGALLLMVALLSRTMRKLAAKRRRINKVTGQRISFIREALINIRFVKLFAMEDYFIKQISAIRSKEVTGVRSLLVIRSTVMGAASSVPILAALIAFITYAASGRQLNAAKIFSSVALFNSWLLPLNLLPRAIAEALDAFASARHIEDFLLTEQCKDEVSVDPEISDALIVEDATFAWHPLPKSLDSGSLQDLESNEKGSDYDNSLQLARATKDEAGVHRYATRSTLVLSHICLTLTRGEMIGVVGRNGSGKSSLLSAVAGQMQKIQGSVRVSGSRSFCPQQSWIQNASVRDNILFGRDFNDEWYNEVISACCLKQDLQRMVDGDRTEIGERGFTLSGGQKQRLGLARAIYGKDFELILLDDPLAAVDASVGRQIMNQAICGLLRQKSRILVTHKLWALKQCDKVIVMEHGRIAATGSVDVLMSQSPTFAQLVTSGLEDANKESSDGTASSDVAGQEENADSEAAKLIQKEEMPVEAIPWSTYKAYIKASGSIWLLPVLLVLLALGQGTYVVTNLWLSWWISNSFAYRLGKYIGIYAAIGVSQLIFMCTFSIVLALAATKASNALFHRAFINVLRQPVTFYDTTPLGRLIHRFSKDMEVLDNLLIQAIQTFSITLGMVVAILILIIARYWYFAIAVVPLLMVLLGVAAFYRPSARDIKRYHIILRSHVYAQFVEPLGGIPTIRAHGAQSRFLHKLQAETDNLDSAYFLSFANQRWLSVRLDWIGHSMIFVLGMLVVNSRFSISPSTGGLALSYLMSSVQFIQYVLRQFIEVEKHMNSTERVRFYGSDLEPEGQRKPTTTPPETWPQNGEIVFNDVHLRYREGLPLALKGVSFHIRAGERVGIVGRTGAGKSSIVNVLFRLVDLTSGSISIDGIPTANVDIQTLRSKMTSIPQDPVLFPGTVRSNLDPMEQQTDAALQRVLDQVRGSSGSSDQKSASRMTLDDPVMGGGSNFSQGQRQLLVFARALLRNDRIMVLDEATSSIDQETERRIQRLLDEHCRGKTILCIAHRLRTVMHFDRIIVIDDGEMVGFDTPRALYDGGGLFRSMCDENSVSLEELI